MWLTCNDKNLVTKKKHFRWVYAAKGFLLWRASLTFACWFWLSRISNTGISNLIVTNYIFTTKNGLSVIQFWLHGIKVKDATNNVWTRPPPKLCTMIMQGFSIGSPARIYGVFPFDISPANKLLSDWFYL